MAVHLDHGEDTLDELHEINVTPFIDVMLVLLIIFMIAAPLATVDIAVNLPGANAERASRPDKPLFVTLKADLSILVDSDAVQRNALAATLDRSTGGDKEQRVYLRADKAVPYGALMDADEYVARCRLSARRAGRPAGTEPAAKSATMSARRRIVTIARWGACFALVLGAHAAGAMALLDWRADVAAVASAPVILVDLAPVPAAPATTKSDLPPGPQRPQMQAQPTPEPKVEPKPELKPEPTPPKPVEKVEVTPEPPKPAQHPVDNQAGARARHAAHRDAAAATRRKAASRQASPPPRQSRHPRQRAQHRRAAGRASRRRLHRAPRVWTPTPCRTGSPACWRSSSVTSAIRTKRSAAASTA